MNTSIIILDLDKLSDNIDNYFSKHHKKIMAVVKNNAYGHGLLPICKHLDNNDKVAYFVVINIKEALTLRRNKIQKPILVLMPPLPKDYKLCLKYNLEISLVNMNEFYKLVNYKYQGQVHLKFNSGLNRLGLNEKELKIAISSPLNIKAIYTHYSGSNIPLVKKEQERFIKIINSLPKNKKYLIHDLSTNSEKFLNSTYSTYLRIGLGIYGLDLTHKQVMSLKAPIINILKIKKGEKVNYEGNFIAPFDGYISCIPIGYGDGLNRQIKLISKDYLQCDKMTMNYLLLYSKDYPTSQTIDIFSEEKKITSYGYLTNLSTYEITSSLSPKIKRVTHCHKSNQK